ncbi:ogr/Delta-like zinc finger family protein [Thauera phenylacetica]
MRRSTDRQHARPHISCPVCGDVLRIYASRPVSAHHRELFCRCLSEACEASFRSLLVIEEEVIPSSLPPGDPQRLEPGSDPPLLRVRQRQDAQLEIEETGA